MKGWLARATLQASALLLPGNAALAREPWLDYVWLVKVKPGGKRYIYSHGTARPGCNEIEPCLTKAYVVAGDVLVASEFGTLGRGAANWIEVEYVSPSGRSTFGWLRDADLEPLSDPQTSLSTWIGDWKRSEANITMRRGRKQGTIAVSGVATWGTFDPDRVRSGGVNIGEVEGMFQPNGSKGGFTMSESGNLPFEQGGKLNCRIRFRLLSPYLLVEDNGSCGGLNVSFLGTYVRKGR